MGLVRHPGLVPPFPSLLRGLGPEASHEYKRDEHRRYCHSISGAYARDCEQLLGDGAATDRYTFTSDSQRLSALDETRTLWQQTYGGSSPDRPHAPFDLEEEELDSCGAGLMAARLANMLSQKTAGVCRKNDDHHDDQDGVRGPNVDGANIENFGWGLVEGNGQQANGKSQLDGEQLLCQSRACHGRFSVDLAALVGAELRYR
jgi:hypothetical protein